MKVAAEAARRFLVARHLLAPARSLKGGRDAVLEVFDLRPAAIIRDLDLLRPIYAKTAAYGHFGRELPEFTWEGTDRAEALKAAIGG